MRFVKYSSKEQGSWTSNDSKLLTFEVPLSDDIDHRKSYLILNMGVEDPNGINNLMFGSPQFNVPYRSCALIQNSSLKSDTMASPLEYNQDVNLYMINKKHYETGFTEENALSFFQKSAHFDNKTYKASTPFLSGVSYDAGDVAAQYKTSNVIIPLSDVLVSFGNSILSKKVGNKLTYQFELDKTHNLFRTVNDCIDPINIIPCPDFTANAGNVRQITSTATYGNVFLTGLRNEERVIIRYTNGGNNSYKIKFLSNAAGNGVTINADGKLVLNIDAAEGAVWDNGQNYTNISVSRAMEAVDYVNCIDVAPGGSNTLISIDDEYGENSNPFYVGQRVKIVYSTTADLIYNEVFRNITEIDFTVDGDLEITVDGNAIPESSQVLVTGATVLKSNYDINKADLVLYQGQMGVDLPKNYTVLEQMPRNKISNTLTDETYLLRPNTLLAYFMQGSSTELISFDPNLRDYRLYLDNKPTTEQNIELNSSMSRDIKLRIFGARLKNLNDSLNRDLNDRKVIVEETKGKSMLQITMRAGVNGQMAENILYMFSIVEKQLGM